MADDAQTRFSLRRWSQRKLAAASRAEAPRADARREQDGDARTSAVAPQPAAEHPSRTTISALTEGRPQANPTPAPAVTRGRGANTQTPAAQVELPPLDSLTIDSDFSPFMQPGVDEALKRSALRKLLRHPRFNVMDGLDVYIDDYSKPSPLEPEIARTLAHARYLFNPPKTRVNAEGIVEDVPDEADDVAAAATDADPAAAPAPLPGAAAPDTAEPARRVPVDSVEATLARAPVANAPATQETQETPARLHTVSPAAGDGDRA